MAAPISLATLDVDALYVALDRQRRSQRLTWRKVAQQVGVCPSAFSRMSQLKRPDVDGLVRLLLWLGDTDLKPFVRPARGPQTASAADANERTNPR